MESQAPGPIHDASRTQGSWRAARVVQSGDMVEDHIRVKRALEKLTSEKPETCLEQFVTKVASRHGRNVVRADLDSETGHP